jgi:hypothetical protein
MKKLGQALFKTLPGKILIGALIIMGPALLEEAFAINDMLAKTISKEAVRDGQPVQSNF